MKVVFAHDGVLPAQFQDFYSDPFGRYPNITLVTRKAADPAEEDEGWLFIVVDEEQITQDRAREKIAEAIGLSPADIELRSEETYT